jgi:parvulin-like peptidyl-prolyl isomerase
MKRRIIFLVLLLVVVLVVMQCTREERVATVGSISITKSQFVSELSKSFGYKLNYQDINLERKKNILNGMIKRKLKVAAAYDLDLEDEKEIENAVQSQRKRLIGDKYFERVIVDQLVPQQDIDDFITRQGIEFTATHVLIGYKGANVTHERSRDEALALANDVAQQAKSGADFSGLVMKYSDEPNAKSLKGVLQPFKWGQMAKPFMEATWKLKKGEISDPVETQYGFHIIRLDDRRELPDFIPNKSPDNLDRTKRTLYQAKADSGRIVWEKHYNMLKEEYRMVLDTIRINETVTLLTDKIKSEAVTAESFTREQKKTKLATWKGGSITLQTLLDNYGDRLTRVIGRFRQPGALQREIENMASLEIAVRDAVQYDIEEEADVKNMLEGFREDRLAQLVEKREVTEKTTVSDEEVQKYYDANPDKFTKDTEIELWQIVVKDEQQARTIAAKARAGTPFTDLVKKYTTDKMMIQREGYLGFRTINSLAPVSQEAFKLGPNKIGGPVQNRTGWAVFKTGKKNEKTLKPFNEILSQGRNLLRGEKIKENRAAWEKELENTYTVKVFDDVLNQI